MRRSGNSGGNKGGKFPLIGVETGRFSGGKFPLTVSTRVSTLNPLRTKRITLKWKLETGVSVRVPPYPPTRARPRGAARGCASDTHTLTHLVSSSHLTKLRTARSMVTVLVPQAFSGEATTLTAVVISVEMRIGTPGPGALPEVGGCSRRTHHTQVVTRGVPKIRRGMPGQCASP